MSKNQVDINELGINNVANLKNGKGITIKFEDSYSISIQKIEDFKNTYSDKSKYIEEKFLK